MIIKILTNGNPRVFDFLDHYLLIMKLDRKIIALKGQISAIKVNNKRKEKSEKILCTIITVLLNEL